MKDKTLSIAHLFADNLQADYSESFQKWDSTFCFILKKAPTKEELLASLPVISDRDNWRLRMLTVTDEDLFDISKGKIIDVAYESNKLLPYIDENVRLVYTIDKNKSNDVLTLYDLLLFLKYVSALTVTAFYYAFYKTLQDKLILEVWGTEYEQFVTSSIAIIKRGDEIPEVRGNQELKLRNEVCGKFCQWTSKLPNLLPDDLHIDDRKRGGRLANLIDQASLLLSACYVADFSCIEKSQWRIRISGFKAVVSEGSQATVADMAFDEKSVDQWFAIYDWCYTGGYTSERLTIARNILSLNCPDYKHLKINDSTLDAIKSNFKIFEQDNVRQYIKVRNDVSKDLLILQDKVNSIVEGFTGDFRKSVAGLGTFFLTLVVVRMVANGQWSGAFSTQIVGLSFLFIVVSIILLIYSRLTLEKKEKLYTKHYKQLRERYEPLLSKEEADKIFDDGDPNKIESHSNYIQWQKKCYTRIWIFTLVLFSIFLVVAWCHNLFESTNLYKVIKAIVTCCTKSILR